MNPMIMVPDSTGIDILPDNTSNVLVTGNVLDTDNVLDNVLDTGYPVEPDTQIKTGYPVQPDIRYIPTICPSWCQKSRIWEESLESGNLFSRSWILPLYRISSCLPWRIPSCSPWNTFMPISIHSCLPQRISSCLHWKYHIPVSSCA